MFPNGAMADSSDDDDDDSDVVEPEPEGENWDLVMERDSSHERDEEDDDFNIDLFGATDSTPLAPPSVVRRNKRPVDPSAKKR